MLISYSPKASLTSLYGMKGNKGDMELQTLHSLQKLKLCLFLGRYQLVRNN